MYVFNNVGFVIRCLGTVKRQRRPLELYWPIRIDYPTILLYEGEVNLLAVGGHRTQFPLYWKKREAFKEQRKAACMTSVAPDGTGLAGRNNQLLQRSLWLPTREAAKMLTLTLSICVCCLPGNF